MDMLLEIIIRAMEARKLMEFFFLCSFQTSYSRQSGCAGYNTLDKINPQ